jgi:tRNA nucleotidyltransferase/poly(A) polymerase
MSDSSSTAEASTVRISPGKSAEHDLTAAQRRAVTELLRISPLADELGQRFAKAGHEIHLVGGSVRDALLGRLGDDLDFATDAHPDQTLALVKGWADAIWETGREFGTIGVQRSGVRLEITTFRAEAYDGVTRNPVVRYGTTLLDDLRRRDFAINAMAAALAGDDLGHLYDPHGGVPDLEAGVVRVLHPGSFLDDPTRLLRAVRYETRLGFHMDEESERAARAALAEDAMSTVSGARVRDELMDLLGEHEAPAAVERMRELGLDRALHPALDADPDLVASASLGAAAIGADRALSSLAAMSAAAPEELDVWLAGLHLDANARDAVSRAARVGALLAHELRAYERMPSELRDLLGDEPPEALALALALGAPPEPILRWMTDLRGVGLEIGGDDLIAAGVPEGPAIGDALEETLKRKLDGLVTGREEELETALELAR